MKQNFSKEQIEIGKEKVLKFDECENQLLRTQYEWLIFFAETIPTHGIKEIEWVHGKKQGYSMTRLNDREVKAIDISSIFLMHDALKNIKHFKYNFEPRNGFLSSYIDYIYNILLSYPIIFSDFNIDLYKKRLGKFKDLSFVKQPTFYHGDFTIHNILFDEKNAPIPIDPIHKEGKLWDSFLLDYSKIYQDIDPNSALYTAIDAAVSERCNVSEYKLVQLLRLSHYIRMFPYIKDIDTKNKKIKRFYEIAKELGF